MLASNNVRAICFTIITIVAAGGGCTAEPHAASGASTQPAVAAIHWEKYSADVFARAKRENKFVLLDLEAVWCHWCHVHDEITYNDPKVIEVMNSRYIAVKVDQDSRPDLANHYENYGWPATIVFNADAGEIVKRSGYIPPGPMVAMLEAIIADPTPGPSIGQDEKIEFSRDSALAPTVKQQLDAKFNETYDAAQGGWGTVHKYVDWDAVELCLARARSGDKQAGRRARQTLDAGLKLIDPAWGGVYQYSVAGNWNEPHFEKLMQFQAEMMRIYTLAYAQFGGASYLNAAEDIRRYIATFLTSDQGAFYVSQDADLIQGEHSDKYFALDDAGRRKLGVPHVDTHVYARENGWGICGLLALYSHRQNPEDLAAAIKATNWILANRTLPGGGFRHDATDAAGPYLGDTLSMGKAFLDLYETTADRIWLNHATNAADFIVGHFGSAPDAKVAAGFVTAAAPPTEILRPAAEIDENVAAVRFFNRMAHYSGRAADRQAAEQGMRFLATPKIAGSRTLGIAGILLASSELSTDPVHVTVVGAKSDPTARALFLAGLTAAGDYRRIEWWDRAQGPLMNADVEYPDLPTAAAFICTGNACSSPMTDAARVAQKWGVNR